MASDEQSEDMAPLRSAIGHSPVTPVIGAALAAVGAAVLIAFAVVAQVTAPDPSTPRPRGVVGGRSSSHAIVLPSPTPNAAAGPSAGAGASETGATVVPIAPVVAFLPGGGVDEPTGPDFTPDPRQRPGGVAPDGPKPASGDEKARRKGTGKDRKAKDARGRGAHKARGRGAHKARGGAEDGRNGRYGVLSKSGTSRKGSAGHGKAAGYKAARTGDHQAGHDGGSRGRGKGYGGKKSHRGRKGHKH